MRHYSSLNFAFQIPVFLNATLLLIHLLFSIAGEHFLIPDMRHPFSGLSQQEAEVSLKKINLKYFSRTVNKSIKYGYKFINPAQRSNHSGQSCAPGIFIILLKWA